MTAPNGPILFNSTTGSDSNASGLGPSVAVYGSAASTTSASAVVTGINTNGVSAGDLLWVQSSSGIQFSIIASVDSGTQVTCDQAFANTEASRTWAIGGKRATFENTDSRQLFNDLPAGGTVETESDQTMTTTIEGSMAGTIGNNCVVRGSIGSEVLTSNHSNYLFKFTASFITLSHMVLRSASGSNSAAIRFQGGNSYFLHNIVCNTAGQSYITFTENGGWGAYTVIKDCTIGNMGGYGISQNVMNYTTIQNCLIHDNALYGTLSNRSLDFINCIFARNFMQGSVATLFTNYYNCIFWKNGAASGVRPALTMYAGISVVNCIFAENYQDAISGSATAQYKNTSGNVFYNNVGSDYTVPLPQFTDNLTLTADPFVDAANLDFNIKSSSVLAGVNYNLGSKTTVHPFRQFVSSYFQTSNSTMKIHPLA
jgi:hypothetical protein